MSEISALQVHGYSDKAPVHLRHKQTQFLREFCTQHNIELQKLLFDKERFRVYSVRYGPTSLNCLIHYCGKQEESAIVQNDYALIEETLT